MVGDAEHEQVRSIVGSDVAAVKCELREVVFVFNEGGNRICHIVPDAGQYVKARGKGRFRPEIPAGNIADVEADPKTGVGLYFVLIPGDSNQGIKRQRVNL